MHEPTFLDFLSLPEGFCLFGCEIMETTITLQIMSSASRVNCPACQQPSERVHSRYLRTIADLPCAGRQVILRQTVRKFICTETACWRTIFSEQYPELAAPCAHKTHRLCSALQALGLATSGEAGARLAEKLAMKTSAATLLRQIQDVPLPPAMSVRVVGIDDWCWKRGQRYGTILVDLERQTVIDLLPDRSAASVQQWLAAHPEIEIVSRDRGGCYADGARRGAKQAQQVADRWHLAKNLGEAIEIYLIRQRIQVPAPFKGPATKEPDPIVPRLDSIKQEQAIQAKVERKQALVDQARDLSAQGLSIRVIAMRLDIARNTVRRYLRCQGEIQTAMRPRRSSLLDPYYDFLMQRWSEGCSNAHQLFNELRAKGYQGGEVTVRNFVARLRKDLPGLARPLRKSERTNQPSYSPRELRWLLAKSEEDLRTQEQTDLARLLETSEEIRVLHCLLHQFLHMLRERKAEGLQTWIDDVRASGIQELQRFVVGIERDRNAVEAGLRLCWSQGQTEGQVNRLKMLKRMMYGRAGFALLRQRVLHRG